MKPRILEKRRLKRIAERWTVQGPHHCENIELYFETMIRAAKEEFREDNAYTLGTFLEECFSVALDRQGLARPKEPEQ